MYVLLHVASPGFLFVANLHVMMDMEALSCAHSYAWFGRRHTWGFFKACKSGAGIQFHNQQAAGYAC
jgi:hypothetical protein